MMVEDPATAAIWEYLLSTLEAQFQLAIHFRIGVGEFHAMIERAAVSAGELVLREQGAKDPTKPANIAMLTGLYRDTISKLQKMEPGGVREKPFQNPARRIIRGWTSKEGYCDSDGSPKILPIKGKAPSFETLAHGTIGPDLMPAQVLEHLRRLGCVINVSGNCVQLIRSEVVDKSSIEQIGRLKDVCSLIRTHIRLIQQGEPIPYHRYIETTGLQPEVAGVQQEQLTRGADLLFDTHQSALSRMRDHPQGGSKQKDKLGLGMWIMREREIVTRESQSALGRTRKKRAGRSATKKNRR